METRITRKGQITIPVQFRRQLGLNEGDTLNVTQTDCKKPELRLTRSSNFENLLGVAKSPKKYNKKEIERVVTRERIRDWVLKEERCK